MDEQFEKLKKAAPGYDIVPVVKEIFSDVRTPIAVTACLKTGQFLLFSAGECRTGGELGALFISRI